MDASPYNPLPETEAAHEAAAVRLKLISRRQEAANIVSFEFEGPPRQARTGLAAITSGSLLCDRSEHLMWVVIRLLSSGNANHACGHSLHVCICCRIVLAIIACTAVVAAVPQCVPQNQASCCKHFRKQGALRNPVSCKSVKVLPAPTALGNVENRPGDVGVQQ